MSRQATSGPTLQPHAALLLAQQQNAVRAEAPVQYRPSVILDLPGHTAGAYRQPPRGVILHGSRSGLVQTLDREFYGTASYAQNPNHELGWTATIGEDKVALHMSPFNWGWNARRASGLYLAVEFANPSSAYDVTERQVRAFCWVFTTQFLRCWPSLPRYFPTHAEVERAGETGQRDGKTDVFPLGDPRAEDLRARIQAHLDAPVTYI